MDVNFSGIGWRFGNWVACMVGGLAAVGLSRASTDPDILHCIGFGVYFDMNTVFAR
jgi:hypothetical protein